MKYAALVPVKALSEVKSRLAPHLTQAQRATLVLDMLNHVLSVLHESNVLDHVSVVSPDRFVLEQAQFWGARALQERRAGHNPALTTAALHEMAAGTDALLTISADLPLLDSDDIRCLIRQSETYQVVLAASHEGTGTNALLTRPPLAVPYVFGQGSLQRHLREAQKRELLSYVYSSPGLELDIDTIDDLERFRNSSERKVTSPCYCW